MKPPALILIAPVRRSGVAALSRKQPLVLAPFVGATVLEHALSHYAAQGVRHLILHVGDRPEPIREVVGRGERWGIDLHLVTHNGEPEAEDLRSRLSAGTSPLGAAITVLDRLPQLPNQPLWTSYAAWFSAQLALLAASAHQHVGLREVAPGVLVGLRSRIARDATLRGPCRIGANVRIGAGAIIGPDALIEDRAFVDEGAEVAGSLVGPDTYVGAHTEVRNSYVHGTELLNLRNGSRTTITDRFLLGDLAGAESPPVRPASPEAETGSRPWWAGGRRLLRRLRLVVPRRSRKPAP